MHILPLIRAAEGSLMSKRARPSQQYQPSNGLIFCRQGSAHYAYATVWTDMYQVLHQPSCHYVSVAPSLGHPLGTGLAHAGAMQHSYMALGLELAGLLLFGAWTAQTWICRGKTVQAYPKSTVSKPTQDQKDEIMNLSCWSSWLKHS